MPTVYIIIYSLYHHVYTLAQNVQKGLEAQGVTAKLFQVPETLSDDILEKMHAPPKPDIPVITVDDLTKADAFLFGIPTRFGTLPAQMKSFLDATGGLWASGALSGKFVGTFFSTASQHGGQETTAYTLLTYFAHHGLNYVPLGFANAHLFDNSEVVGGSAYGAGTVANGDGSRLPTDKELDIAKTQGENFAKLLVAYHRGLEIVDSAETKEASPSVPAAKDVDHSADVPVSQKPPQTEKKTSSLKAKKEDKKESKCFCIACKAGMEVLKRIDGSAIEAVAKAIQILEDEPLTNAGYGSSLTLRGTVECDAGLMEGKTGTFGAVGAVSGVKNPIMTAKQMVQEGMNGLLSLGRIPPMLLVGQGAKEWTKTRGYPIVEDESLIEQSSFKTYIDHISRLVEYQEQNNQLDLGHDTVGAICIDRFGNMASGVSSGGISLKAPGRVGEAAMYGCGCWAQNEKGDVPGVACSTTGTGEQIMRTMLTYKCATRLQNEDDVQSALANTLTKDFLGIHFQAQNDIVLI
ncbi:hypothetical protein G6F43_002163 [Rhizopus delemar]|nr:hypothetical protein G6F43_002163 [Rhizopus delemar]